jgi:hypothetical protein
LTQIEIFALALSFSRVPSTSDVGAMFIAMQEIRMFRLISLASKPLPDDFAICWVGFGLENRKSKIRESI